jgi:rhamnulokinase
VAPCTHDTAAAVAAVPAVLGTKWAFISSGTWSVVGAPAEKPVLTDAVHRAGFCNELTIGGLFLCANITGLWILQQVRVAWAREGRSYSYEELTKMMKEVSTQGQIIDPEDPEFVAPSDMLDTIQQYCNQSDQAAPKGPGEVSRVIIESLALCYRRNLEQLSRFLSRRFEVLHIIGGGARNELLCQFTSNAMGIPVVAGPAEATAAGNLLSQATAFGDLRDANEIRQVLRNSEELTEYVPQDFDYWQKRYEKFTEIGAS